MNKKGFTLIEVLIVVIILAILATISIPQFSKMTKRARLAEAWTGLAAIRTAEAVYYLSWDTYTTNTSVLDMDLQQDHFGFTVAGASATDYNAMAVGVAGGSYANIVAWMVKNGCNGYDLD
jgi:prepilin-type N-terminal cleavage/methylation domain-containing protein